ncbi:hypothetical protein EYF80_012252 [Liparis tanakae]|uniref:Uncharacterized protein n=1 Tax=Liparis tanakae TaxID=230148 RepID=A0A4Z2IHW3_9TELE|nr:hypothetical protein EYF80_012252 [Liparis tanakae]
MRQPSSLHQLCTESGCSSPAQRRSSLPGSSFTVCRLGAAPQRTLGAVSTAAQTEASSPFMVQALTPECDVLGIDEACIPLKGT